MRGWRYLGNDEWDEADVSMMDDLAESMAEWNAGSLSTVAKNGEGAIVGIHSIAHVGDGVLVGVVLTEEGLVWAMK